MRIMTIDAKTTNAAGVADDGPGLDRKTMRARMRQERLGSEWREQAERAQRRYVAARKALADILTKASSSPDEADESCHRVACDLRKGLPPESSLEDADFVAAMQTVASLAPERAVDLQSASHVALLHAHTVAALAAADYWSMNLWKRAFDTDHPGWLAHAYKPLAESVRCMRAHADIVGKLERRRLRRGRIEAKRAAEADPAKRAEEREQIEEALAEVGPKAA
jgi:hypothetical protein